MSYILQHSEKALYRLFLQDLVYGDYSKELLIKSGLKPWMRVLEVGTGSADMSLWLSQYVTHGEVISIDVSKEYVDRANNKVNNKNFKAIELDVYNIDQSLLGDFDLVYCRMVS
ncbi:hypothetical protein DA717_15040, partial [Piscirickettsiaceae bacterium NZ-RLO2]